MFAKDATVPRMESTERRAGNISGFAGDAGERMGDRRKRLAKKLARAIYADMSLGIPNSTRWAVEFWTPIILKYFKQLEPKGRKSGR